MKKRNLLLVMLAILLAFSLVMSCGPAEEDPDNPSGGGNTATLNSVTANGSGLETTTELTLTFDKAITGLTATNITLGTGATKGSLSGSGPVYTLTVTGVTADATVSVAVSRSGWTISGSPGSVAVKYSAAGKAAKYFNKALKATYTLSSGKAIEQIQFTDKETLNISELSVGTTASTDFISAKIEKWEDVSSIPDWGTEYDTYPSDEFTIGFKITGYITDAKPKDSTVLYGSKTAPDYKLSDINAKTSAIMYFYVLDDGTDIVFVRSVFSKDGTKKDPVTGSDADTSVRVYVDLTTN